MKVSEAIDRLKVGDTVWVKGEINYVNQSESFPVCCDLAETSIWICKADEISLTEPKNEKVEVPSMIDKFINENSDPIFEICAWSDHYGNDGRTCDDPELSVVLDWYGNNTTEFYEAVVNGYTVKPKRWVVKKGKDCVLTSFTFFDEQSVNYNSNSYGKDYLIFTDKSKAEAVATLIDGSVEEV